MKVNLDLYEYANDAAAQAAYISNDKFVTYESTSNPFQVTGGCRGLDFDGTYYYVGIYSTGIKVYDTSYSLVKTIPESSAPTNLGHGAATDGTYVWTSDYSTNKKIYQYRISDGGLITSWVVPSPMGNPTRIKYDGTYLWISCYADGKLYKVDTSGNLITSFSVTTANLDPQFIIDKDGNILVGDTPNTTMRKYSQAGTLLATYTGTNACGIGYDICNNYNNKSIGSYAVDGSTYITFYRTNLECFSESTIKTQGSYSLKGISTTGALNKTLIKTIGSPINLSGINQIKFDIRSSRTGANIKIGLHDSGGTTTEITSNIESANTWQEVKINLQNIINANKDAIDQIIITIVNADAANTFYIDNMFSYYISQAMMIG